MLDWHSDKICHPLEIKLLLLLLLLLLCYLTTMVILLFKISEIIFLFPLETY